MVSRANGELDLSDTPVGLVLAINGRSAVFSSKGEEHTSWTIGSLTRTGSLDMAGVGESRGVKLKGIYRLKGDTLTYCFGTRATTTNFDLPPSGVYTMVVERKKP